MNMASHSIRIFFCLVWCAAVADLADAGTQWASVIEKSYAEVVLSTSDGGYLLAGEETNNYDAWCVKLDSTGSIVWQKRYGGGDEYEDCFTDAQQTSDGGYILVGWTYTFGTGEADAWIVRIDSSGNIVWQRSYGDANLHNAMAVQPTGDGGYLVVGGNGGGTSPSYSAWCIKLDSTGSVVWQRSYMGTSFRDIQPTSDGGHVLVGCATVSASFQAYCVKLGPTGNTVWQKAYGGSSDDYARSVRETSDGGYILAGTTGSGGGDAWCVKTDSAGSVVWQKTYDGSYLDTATSVLATSDGGYLFVGETDTLGAGLSDTWCVKLDSTGNIVWQKAYGGGQRDFALGVQATGDDGYILAGGTSSFGAGTLDTWCLKLTSTGDIDPSCGTLVSTAGASAAVWAAISMSITPGTTTRTTPSPTSTAAAVDTSATVSVLCSGGGGSMCTYTVGAFSTSYGYEGGVAEVPVTTQPECEWTASSAVSWITFDPASGLGTGTAGMMIQANPGAARNGAVTVAGRVYTISQEAYGGGGDCPTITKVTARTAKPGSVMTIKGTNFSSDKKKVVVWLGTKRCTVMRTTLTQIRCTIPRLRKGTYDLWVVVDGKESAKQKFTVK